MKSQSCRAVARFETDRTLDAVDSSTMGVIVVIVAILGPAVLDARVWVFSWAAVPTAIHVGTAGVLEQHRVAGGTVNTDDFFETVALLTPLQAVEFYTLG